MKKYKMNTPMMKCGHAANAVDSEGKPVCVICHGIVDGATEIDESPPGLEGRKARCVYYGKVFHFGYYGNECSVCGKRDDNICHCERDSDTDKLAFFEHRPGEEFDLFYCGCHSWD